MKKLITLLFLALTTAGSTWADNDYTCVLFGNSTGVSGLTTDAFTLNNTVPPQTQTLSDNSTVKVSLNTNNGGKFWSANQDNTTWSNQLAIDDINSDLLPTDATVKFTADNFKQGGWPYIYPGWDQATTLTLTLADSYTAGRPIVLYVTVASGNSGIDNLSVTGLGDNYTQSYATNSGNGFSTTSAFTTNKGITMVKLTGTVPSDKIITLTSTSTRNGWQMLAYRVATEAYTVNYVDASNTSTILATETQYGFNNKGVPAADKKSWFGWSQGVQSSSDKTITVPMVNTVANKMFYVKTKDDGTKYICPYRNAQTTSGTWNVWTVSSEQTPAADSHSFVFENAGSANSWYIKNVKGDGSSAKGYMTADSDGQSCNGSSTKTAWTISGTNSDFTISNGSTYVAYTTATYNPLNYNQSTATHFALQTTTSSATMRITSAEWATFVAPFDVTLEDDVRAYTATSEAGKDYLALTEVENGTIPAGTPVMLYKQGQSGVYTKTVTGTPGNYDNTVTVGALTGNLSTDVITVSDGDYLLQRNLVEGVATTGWFQIDGSTNNTIGANRCYMTKASAPEARSFYGLAFEESTGISQLKNDAKTLSNGKYIADGKVLVVKNGRVYNLNGTLVK